MQYEKCYLYSFVKYKPIRSHLQKSKSQLFDLSVYVVHEKSFKIAEQVI